MKQVRAGTESPAETGHGNPGRQNSVYCRNGKGIGAGGGRMGFGFFLGSRAPHRLALCVAFCLVLPCAAAVDSVYRGDATHFKTGVPAYTELHRQYLSQGRPIKTQTRYLSPQGGLIAERILDFSRSTVQPDYVMDDFRDGYREGARVGDSTVTVFFRTKSGKPLQEKTLRVPEPFAVEGGFNGFVKAHWDSLIAGGHLAFNLVVPSQLDYFAFTAQMEPGGRTGGNRTLVLEVKSPMLKLLVDPIRVTYNMATRRAIRYEGVSGINDARGKSFKVRTLYSAAAL
jgi:hypothetical protein